MKLQTQGLFRHPFQNCERGIHPPFGLGKALEMNAFDEDLRWCRLDRELLHNLVDELAQRLIAGAGFLTRCKACLHSGRRCWFETVQGSAVAGRAHTAPY